MRAAWAAGVSRRTRRSRSDDHHRQVGALDEIREIVVIDASSRVALLQLLVDRGQLLVGGLQLLLRRLELFVGALQLLVARQHLLVGGAQLLGRGLLLIDDRLQVFAASTPSSWRSRGHLVVQSARRALGRRRRRRRPAGQSAVRTSTKQTSSRPRWRGDRDRQDPQRESMSLARRPINAQPVPHHRQPRGLGLGERPAQVEEQPLPRHAASGWSSAARRHLQVRRRAPRGTAESRSPGSPARWAAHSGRGSPDRLRAESPRRGWRTSRGRGAPASRRATRRP